jgi:hypothetical protein
LVTEAQYPGQDLFHLNPSNTTSLPLPAVRVAARDSMVLHCLRDAVEVAASFLEDVRQAAAFFELSKRRDILGSDLNRVFSESQRFHRLGLPNKIESLRAKYSIMASFDTHVLSLNAARNCIVHRGAIVAPEDVGPDNKLTIQFAEVQVHVVGPEGETTVRGLGAIPVAGGSTLRIGIGPKSKTFTVGARVQLEYEELMGALFSHIQYVNQMIRSLETFAESLGTTFLPPSPAP